MSTYSADELYALLPAFVRLRDSTQGGRVLRALMEVIASQAEVIAGGLDQLYDDQFIETCAPWVVPYIGDLVGFTPLRPLGPGQPASTRGEVADTIGSRRRKGTLAMLEQLCFDVTGWRGIAVEFFTRLATTQYVRNHLRLTDTIVDVGSPMAAVDVSSAFDAVAHTADVRRISSSRPFRVGRHNIPSIGLFVWRLKDYANPGHPAREVGADRFTFDPFGGDVPLVNPPVAPPTTFALLGRENVPFFLQRYPLYAGVAPYAATDPVKVSVDGTAIPANEIGWCDLTNWTAPAASGINVAVDPVLGRLVFATAPGAGAAVVVDYTYAFSGDYGGGSYERTVPADEATLERALPAVTKVPAFSTADLSGTHDEIVEIEDSGIHAGDMTLSPDAHLLVVRAADLQRPVVAGSLTITAVAGASVTLRGIGIGGGLKIAGTGPFTLRLEHCTVRGHLDWSVAAVSGRLVIDHSLCGPLAANPDVEVTIDDSLLDGGSDTAAAVSAGGGKAAGSVTISRSTVLGTIQARILPLLENGIVTGAVVASERQSGCVRYSFVPLAGSQTPRRFRCQPDLEIDTEVRAARDANPGLTKTQSDAIAATVTEWLQPVFTSRTPGNPGYVQLAEAAPDQIRFGAEEGDEMGVFFGLYTARREANFRHRLDEFLRIGLEAGIIHAT